LQDQLDVTNFRCVCSFRSGGRNERIGEIVRKGKFVRTDESRRKKGFNWGGLLKAVVAVVAVVALSVATFGTAAVVTAAAISAGVGAACSAAGTFAGDVLSGRMSSPETYLRNAVTGGVTGLVCGAVLGPAAGIGGSAVRGILGAGGKAAAGTAAKGMLLFGTWSGLDNSLRQMMEGRSAEQREQQIRTYTNRRHTERRHLEREGDKMDEQIAKLATEQYDDEHSESTRDGPAKINGRFYAFGRRLVLNDRLSVLIPEDFAEMPEGFAKIKYPSGDRPNTIISDERGAVCFTFNTIDSPLDNESARELAEEMKSILQRLNPSYVFFDSGIIETEQGGKTGFTEYKSPALDDTVYNLMYFAPLDGITMMGTFSCPYGEFGEWRPKVEEILSLIEIVEKEEESDA
jgi:hypothetical protein